MLQRKRAASLCNQHAYRWRGHQRRLQAHSRLFALGWNVAKTGALVTVPDGPDADTAPDLVRDPFRNAPNYSDDGVVFRICPGCSPFYAYAERPLVIDKRGPGNSEHVSQGYQCSTGNTVGSCTIPTAAGGSSQTSTNPSTHATRTFVRDDNVLANRSVNLGDSRIEGLMIQTLRIQSCGGVPAC